MNNLVQLLHKITQQNYSVSFDGDFEGMVRIGYTKEFDDEFYEHDHVGFPNSSMEDLEKAVLRSLQRFAKEHIKE